jgi:hypothetical protein
MSGSSAARIGAILLGMLAVLAIPVAIALAIFLPSVDILPALIVAIPAAFVLGLLGISVSRRARFGVERSVYRVGEGSVRFGRFLIWTGIYASVVGGLALGVYGMLRAAG